MANEEMERAHKFQFDSQAKLTLMLRRLAENVNKLSKKVDKISGKVDRNADRANALLAVAKIHERKFFGSR